MFAQEVLVKKLLLHRRQSRIQCQVVPRHERDLFEHDGIVHRLFCVLAPAKRAVAVHQNGGDAVGVEVPEPLDDHIPCFQLVTAADLLRGHPARAGDLAVEIIAVRCAERGDAAPRLCKNRSPARVCMHHAADILERAVQDKVRIRVGGRIQISFHGFSRFKIDHDQIRRVQRVVFHTGGLDDHQALLPVYARHIAPCKRHKVVFGKPEVRFPNCLF